MTNFVTISIFSLTNVWKMLCFWKIVIIHHTQNFVSSYQILCDEHKTFCHRLVHLKFVTNTQTPPSERPHSSDMISWKNRLQTHHIALQNVETKSSPKISFQFCGRKIAHPKIERFNVISIGLFVWTIVIMVKRLQETCKEFWWTFRNRISKN